MAENLIRTDYSYDNRGNLIREETGGTLIHGYEYGAMNRLSKSWDDKGQEAIYLYNGLGQRTGKNANGDAEDYLLDLTRGYHNLIGIQKGESKQHFYFGDKVTAMEESESGKNPAGRTAFSGLHYYLQDNAEVHSSYDKQGTGQPFGFTGYRHDEVSGTCFAQAKEYQPGSGRFVAEDMIKGDRAALVTLNQYGYCWGNPYKYIDINGKEPEDYEYVYYVNNPSAAGSFDHTAFLLVRENGMAEYYSYSTVSGEYLGKIFDSPADKKEYEGRFFTNISGGEPSDVDIDDFIEKGSVNEEWYADEEWHERENDAASDRFTRGIIIPISNEQGEKIHEAACMHHWLLDQGLFLIKIICWP